jgi:hypothetical protein
VRAGDLETGTAIALGLTWAINVFDAHFGFPDFSEPPQASSMP